MMVELRLRKMVFAIYLQTISHFEAIMFYLESEIYREI